MRVFVTGATGFIGQAVVRELLAAGHQVVGLARSDKGAEMLTAMGAEVLRGSLEDLASLKQGASAADGVIHLAFIHDFSDYEASCRVDRSAIEALGAALKGSNRPLIITSGTLLLPQGRLATEEDTPDLSTPTASARGQSEQVALSLVSQGVRVSIVRLPPTNHGDGDHGFVKMLINLAREKGVSAYIGDGLNCWPATHRLDAASVYKLALAKGSAGSIFHAVAEEGVKLKDIAEEIGKQLNVSVASKPLEEAQEHFGWLGFVVAGNNPTSSAITREKLGWSPVQPSLLADIKTGTYFDTK
ncbi:NAD dependent epimerase/dehydratase family protein [Basidiobolus meristosporus CBS 931.73]|uniref:NAD dependent epimerase/dehydratase family protein n=1 Tax=Basidiobolus meristosporus CBS 931.73 TaxID=1314790 RepID=A0A1Y1YJZ2_9FUNG|nr:NAD dependent epimerase/dehydratase family protein [Basidiobolus meristosporus CBS 931.73]|eukprot:ORX98163.1 NAD dependent epimerase/dehydratase family protein [Basidiobolus meristosporus CBS 931.73]